LIEQILHTDYVANAGINEFENIRQKLRDLMKYIIHEPPKDKRPDIDDVMTGMEFHEADLENDDLKNYRAKVEFYVRQNQDKDVIAKLKTNVPLTSADVGELERILWSELGTKADYEAEYGQKPLGEFVREIVGLDMNAAKAAFSEYLDETLLDAEQIYFVNQIIEYIVQNGLMKDMSVFQEAPFTDNGGITVLFPDLNTWFGILGVINKINANAIAA
jgi:type I restriction enzyme R subunit